MKDGVEGGSGDAIGSSTDDDRRRKGRARQSQSSRQVLEIHRTALTRRPIEMVGELQRCLYKKEADRAVSKFVTLPQEMVTTGFLAGSRLVPSIRSEVTSRARFY